MIRLISGATRLGGRVYRPEDGAFSADAKVEKNLVDRGVAAYVGAGIPVPKPTPAPAPVVPDGGSTIPDEGPEDSPSLDVEKPKTSRKRR